MNLLKFLNTKAILLHTAFWIGVWFFFIYFFSYNSKDSDYVAWFSSFLLPVTMTTSYYVVYQLIPQYLLLRKYLKFALYSFYTLVYSTCFIVFTIIGSFIFLSKLDVTDMPPMSKNFIFILILVYLVVGFMGFVSILNHNFKTISKNKELQNKILETQLQLKDQELNHLKKQIHPHFLFNTLNTIYGFALKQSKHTPEIILKLSNLLDYILYQVNKPKVSLKEEVLHIKEYIELEKIRFKDTLKVSFSSSKIAEEIQVAPMLLIPFVENTFKHGNLINGFLSIEINVLVENNSLCFSIKNTVQPKQDENTNDGIGLENIKKRLDLQYSGNYELNNTIDRNWYIVDLKILDLTLIKDVQNN